MWRKALSSFYSQRLVVGRERGKKTGAKGAHRLYVSWLVLTIVFAVLASVVALYFAVPKADSVTRVDPAKATVTIASPDTNDTQEVRPDQLKDYLSAGFILDTSELQAKRAADKKTSGTENLWYCITCAVLVWIPVVASVGARRWVIWLRKEQV